MFKDTNHETTFKGLLALDQTHEGDSERKALFYIIAGCEGLSQKVHSLYDFEEQMIKTSALEGGVDLTSSEQALVKFGFNLYNSYPSDSIIDTFYLLDPSSFSIALKAIYLRFHSRQQDMQQGMMAMLGMHQRVS